jgi:hypothetical protein
MRGAAQLVASIACALGILGAVVLLALSAKAISSGLLEASTVAAILALVAAFLALPAARMISMGWPAIGGILLLGSAGCFASTYLLFQNIVFLSPAGIAFIAMVLAFAASRQRVDHKEEAWPAQPARPKRRNAS